ncbi:MAG: cysteine desulfurase [Actinobacteria bacterium]|nr:cysteine desulfurase [Actinomycetota bacterium]
MPSHYLDHAATTPVRPEATAAWLAAPGGNASSVHATGRRARRVLEEAREEIADRMSVTASDVIFTSGGTMADNLAVRGIHAARTAADQRRDTIVVSAVEHHAVLDAAAAVPGARVHPLPVDEQGRVRTEHLAELLAAEAGRVSLVSVMSANNEVGTAQPVAEIAALCRSVEVPLHIDAVQSVGSWGAPPVEGVAFSVSGHKFGAPAGIGALVLPAGVPCQPLIVGGGQERKIHSGTLNVAGAAAMAAALAAALDSNLSSGEPGTPLPQLRAELEAGVVAAAPEARIVGGRDRLPGVVSAVFDGCEADALLMLLDAAGIECSTGSACTAGIPEPSHVLAAMGADPATARSALRFSLGWTSTRADVEALVDALPEAVARARRASARQSGRRTSRRLSGTAV